MAKQQSMMLDVDADGAAAFLACLALGTLDAIAAGKLSTEAGIWSLAAPRMWHGIEGTSLVLDRVIAILQQCDELSAIEEATPAGLGPALDRLRSDLLAVLDGQPGWQARWRRD